MIAKNFTSAYCILLASHQMKWETTPTTFPETNISVENEWLEYYLPFGARPHFKGLLLLVFGMVFGAELIPLQITP